MKEFLILSNTRELRHIDSADIWYIDAQENYSDIYLTNGKSITVTMKLKDIEEALKKFLPLYHKDFYRVGRSLIINKIYLFSINLTEKQIELADKRTEGYLAGYSAGYATGYASGHTDACSGSASFGSFDIPSKVKKFTVSRDALKELKKIIEK
ncbi:MAG: LytTR family transcriptional regulator DNA-binding domain-containing protein [Bacteroidales bacterium]|nr:LytTR family transcriptional regulator DNA-binding domain-containing protein [Bacteroidales bacterium]